MGDRVKYKVPLSREDAETIEHAAEIRILEASLPYPHPIDPYAYGEARRWLYLLMQGEEVEIDESALAESRRIMTKRVS